MWLTMHRIADSLATQRPEGDMPVEDITVRTAVVIVHGMGEKRPMETFDSFVRTALHPRDGIWDYQPRAAEITDTYEARRYFATSRETAPQQGHTEFFEFTGRS